MSISIDRRGFLAVAAAGGAAVAAVPARVFATPLALNPRDRMLMQIAQERLARTQAPLWHRDLVAIADFGVHSSKERFHFVNLEQGLVRSFLVTHGSGSDPDHDGWLDWFSNVPGSECSSRGSFMTFGWYSGRYGTSIRLEGLEPSNNNALNRAIVMHPASYATQDHVDRWGRLGRSNGCFAMGPDTFGEALLHLSGGRLLVADKFGIS